MSMTLNELIENYMKLRERKEQMADKMKEELKKYTTAMDTIEEALKAHMHANNLQSIATDSGTAFFKGFSSATLADSGAFRDFVINEGAFEMADFRPNKDAVRAYIESNGGNLPPGVNFSTIQKIHVNKK